MYETTGLKSTLSYTPRAEKDYGFLYCWGKNEVRWQQEPCVFRVIPAGEMLNDFIKYPMMS